MAVSFFKMVLQSKTVLTHFQIFGLANFSCGRNLCDTVHYHTTELNVS